MEIAPGIYRRESYLGKKIMAHHLIAGDRSLLVDAGTPELARDELIPWLTEVLGDPSRLDMVLVTHGDVDHYGGLATLRAACPRAALLVPVRDRRWMEVEGSIFAERYNRYNAYGVSYSAELIRVLEEWGGSCLPVDIGLAGGEDVRLGRDLLLRVLHVPGHTPGHLMLWEPRTRVAIIGDALNGATQVDRDGAWTAPPPYTDREGYLTTIQTVRALAPNVLLTGHYPVMRGHDIDRFVDASRDFVPRTDAALDRLLGETSGPLTLAELIAQANPLLGPFAFPLDLQYALEAHLASLERARVVRQVSRDGVAAWERVSG